MLTKASVLLTPLDEDGRQDCALLQLEAIMKL